ncbi:MAG: gliding motility lipoprotein GldH [Bacteroidota bacterium]
MTRILKYSIIVLLTLLIYSCDSSRVYEENIPVDNYIWERNNISTFTANINDTKSAHNVYINIRNSGSYEFNNVYLFITIASPSGTVAKDTFECILADDRGKWYGSGIGDIFHLQIPYKINIFFPDTGNYVFEFEQAMRVEKLQGISDIGLRIEKSNK